MKNTHDKLNDSLKRQVLLEHELETEKYKKSMMLMELDTFKAIVNEVDENRVESDVNGLRQDCKFLTSKIHNLQVYTFIHLCSICYSIKINCACLFLLPADID